jgi:raffinose/stachyose/melibiose transport system substrate-binding protein
MPVTLPAKAGAADRSKEEAPIPTMRKLFVTAAMAALVVGACGGSAATTAPAPASAAPGESQAASEAPALSGTVRVLIHQNPPFVDYMNAFNTKFQAKYPGVTVDMSVVNANDLGTATQTRLTANDVDVIDIFSFSNAVQPYMKNVNPPGWQSLIDAGLLMDITDQPFVANYDATATKDAGTYNGKVYSINLARVGFSGVYYNKDLFTANNVKVPTTWSELVTACQTFKAANVPCMTAGGKDGWPIFVGAYGLAGATYPDQAALVQGLWEGTIKYTDQAFVDMLAKYQIYDRDMMESGASGLAGDAAPGRFASGQVAMFPGGTWYAPAIAAASPTFQWGYIPFPGSDTADNNKYMFGKYDQGWAIAANTPNKDAAVAYLAEFSDPANYQAFVTAVGAIPTQPGAKMESPIGADLEQYLANFRVGFELYWNAPKGAGQYASPIQANMFKPFGTFDDPAAAAAQAQSDLDSGLNAQ